MARMLEAHHALRSMLNTGGGHPEYGLYQPRQRYNLDEVGLNLFSDNQQTIVIKGADRVRMNTGESGCKPRRFCTLAPMLRAEGVQPTTILVIFEAVSGEKIHKAEAHLYDKRCMVLYQQNAWASSDVLVESVQSMDIEPGSLLFLDGLRAHRGAYQDALREQHQVDTWYGPHGITDTWQRIDRGKILPL